MNPQYKIIAAVILIFIFFITFVSVKQFTPYDEYTIFSKNYPYEGFEQMHHATPYTLNSTQKDDSMKSYLINDANNSNDTNNCKKVYGLDGLFCSPNSTKDQKVDIFSEAKGDLSCYGKSSGLSNSKGSLCLDQNQLNLLITRGGNQTGQQAQIGN
jgi:hypothetical protein